ncbi:MAG: nickel pincer cofactor biosynthesis protein LarC [Clostridia bacterium]|nr:nickel pincer cofactor biosynthesis protein LarC [Clostridia bacterium]
MKTIYLDCNMGAAGDMLMAALLELHPDPDDFLRRFNSLEIPGVRAVAEPSVKCGITGAHVMVTVNGEEETSVDAGHDDDLDHEREHEHDHDHCHQHEYHHHSDMHEIEHLIGHLPLSEKVRADALAVYCLIAEAESSVHGKPVDQVHFHEVGSMDAVADIVGVCMLMEELGAERVLASPVHVGCGQVRCAHGVLPVPAPATAYILKGVPIYGGHIRGELCTPTGAALLKHFVAAFGVMPVMTVSAIGYGMGRKDFEAANCVRASIGVTEGGMGEVSELCCNLDDMTPEAIGFVQELLFQKGALDVYTIPIGMKKSRLGVLLTCMCRREMAEEMAALLFRHTSTLGVREIVSRRYSLHRETHTAPTPYGPVAIKTSTGWGVTKSKAEYEDVARIARKHGLSFAEVQALIEKA